MKTLLLPATAPNAVSTAAEIIRSGGLVAYPTDTLYGLGAHAYQSEAIGRIFTAKGRAENRPLPLLIAETEQLTGLARDIPIGAWRLAAVFWPGALTLVLLKQPRVPSIIAAGGDTVAVRVPKHEITLALIRRVGAPIAGTSANVSGQQPAISAADAFAQLSGRIDAILDGGACPGGVESTVVDLTGGQPRLLRRGAIDPTELEDVLEQRIVT